MSDIIIKDGNLYKDGAKIQLEFGNLEQITAIRNYERKLKEFEDGFTPEVSYSVKAKVAFKCICGSTRYVETSADSEDDVECFDGLTETCSCKRKYEFVLEKKYINIGGKNYLTNGNLILKNKK